MFIFDVIPIARGIQKEKLSYWSVNDLPIGSLVEIPLRKKTAKAIVVNKKEALDFKSQIRQADFSLKKITSVKAKDFLSEAFMESALKASDFFAGTVGAILNNCLPKAILENSDKIKTSKPADLKQQKDSHEKLLIQSEDEERFSTYKRLIREEFAKNFSVLFIVPTLEDIQKARELLERGIENYTFCLSSFVSAKELPGLWNKILKEDHPLLVIATAQFLCLPRKDFNLIIIERENSGAYKQLSRPYLDMRTFAEILSKKSGIKLLLGDSFLRTETIWREKNLEFADIAPLKFRSISNVSQNLVILKKEQGQEFSPISPELERLIDHNLAKKEHLFIFGSRKGLYPIIQCNDCGEGVKCQNCSVPQVLHQNLKERFLLCHKCGSMRKVILKCENCQSWRLEPLGIGLELLEEHIIKNFPSAKVFRIDKQSAKTAKQVSSKIAKFLQTKGGILIGTEMVLSYLREKIPNVACVAIDALFSIPDFRINEKIFSLCLRCRALSENYFLIQTKNPSLKIWQNVLDGNLAEFYREEIEQREKFNYPPFSILIKITIQGQKSSAEKEAEKLKEIFKDQNPQIYPSFISKIKGRYIVNVLFKISRNSWPDALILKKLISLSPKFTVRIDPDSIL